MALVLGLAAQPTDALPGAATSKAPKAGKVKCKTQTVQKFRPFAAKTWRLIYWERGKPKKGSPATKAQRKRLKCARSRQHLRAMQRDWRKRKTAFFQHRRAELWRVRVTPFFGGGRWWSVPYPIVVCESGARGYVPSGYYGILFTREVPTWQTWGEKHFAPTPGQASKREQDIVAHRLYRAYGLQPWECAGLTGLG